MIGLINIQEAWAHTHMEEVISGGYNTAYEIDSEGPSVFSKAVTNMRIENGHLHVDVSLKIMR